jgi:hypothetical protein
MGATNNIPRPVLDRMGYTNPAVVRDWRKLFSKTPPRQTESKPAARTRAVPVMKTRAVKDKAKPETGPFILSRTESPDDFERMSFVLKARSKADTREYLTVLHVEQTKTGSLLVATDGKRLHIAGIAQKIKSGDYKPAVTKDTVSLGKPAEGIVFPAFKRVIPENIRKRAVIDLTNTGMGKSREQTERLSWAFNDFVKKTGELVNLRYLEDLTKTKWAVYCQSEKHKAIVLKQEGAEESVLAVMVPLAETETAEQAA